MSGNEILVLVSDNDTKALYEAVLQGSQYDLTTHSYDDELPEMPMQVYSMVILHFEPSMLREINELVRRISQCRINQASPTVLVVISKSWLGHVPQELTTLADEIIAFPFTPKALLETVNKYVLRGNSFG